LCASFAACGGGSATNDSGTVPSGGGGAGGAGGESVACAMAAAQGTGSADAVTFLPNVTVSTVAGGATSGTMDGPVATAQLGNPVSVIIEPAGTLVVCDFDNDRLRRIDLGGGTVSTMTKQTNFLRPYGLALGSNGTLYVDTDYNPTGEKTAQSGTVWRVDTSTGTATVVAANLGRPRGLAVLPDSRLVLGDYQNARVRVLDPGAGTASDLVGAAACAVGANGAIVGPGLAVPYGVAVLPSGGVVIADESNHVLRNVSLDGALSAFAGTGETGTSDGPRLMARFAHPVAVAADAAGDVFVSDYVAHRIRRVAADGTVTTVAGDGTGGFKDGPGAQAQFWGQEGLTVTPDGKTLYVADGTGGQEGTPYNRLRKITIAP
jgi:sugar lactone lactonase YvrE